MQNIIHSMSLWIFKGIGCYPTTPNTDDVAHSIVKVGKFNVTFLSK